MRKVGMMQARNITVLALAVAAQLFFVHAARATSSTVVTANVCSAASTATLAINQPTDGATVTTMPLTLKGSASQISQIRVILDGTYTQTVPLDAGSTSFAFDISVMDGHHSVRLESFDICGRTAPVAELAFDYLPNTQIATGSGDGVSAEGEIKGVDSEHSDLNTHVPDTTTPKEGLPAILAPVVGGLGSVGTVVLNALDISNAASPEHTPKMIARFGLATAGFGAVLFTPAVNLAIAQIVTHISTGAASPAISATFSSPRFRFGLRGLGLALVALAFMI